MRKVAALADFDPTILSRIENGHRLPSDAQLSALAKIYHQDINHLKKLNAFTEIKSKYGHTEYFKDCLQLLNEDAAQYQRGPSAAQNCE